MAVIRIANRGVQVSVQPAHSVLNNFLMQGIPIQTRCGGKAKCGRCRYRVVEGAAGLSPVRPTELARLGESAIADGWRLACQSHALRDLTIELPAMDEEFAREP
ncbi:MAG: 2Fe-2S iron-sulfur cluster-binding protein [Thermodesulfobacteriota bacterium]